MERLQPLSKLVIRNDKTVNQEAFCNFTQFFLEYLESLKTFPPYQYTRANKSTVLKYNSFLFQIITKYPQMAISVSSYLIPICSLLMNPLNDNQIREDSWKLILNSINCYDVLVIFKSFLSKSFEISSQDSGLEIGEVGKTNDDTLFKQFEQITLKLKKSSDFDKVKLTLQIAFECLPISILKSFSIPLRNKVILQLVSEIGLLEKKFKATLFDANVEANTAIYVSEIIGFIPADQFDSQIVYRFLKWTFPFIILDDKNEDVTKRTNMLFYINHSKYRGSLALSYFRVTQTESFAVSLDRLSQITRDSFHNIFIRIIDRSTQILPSMILAMKNCSDSYSYIYFMCKFFTHVLRLKGLTNQLLRFENEKSIIGYFLSISIYNLQFDLLPFMTLFFLSFLVDRKTIDLNEEGHFSDNIISIVHPNYISQISQVVSIFASQMTVGFAPALFQIEDEKLKKQFLKNPVIFEKEKIQNQSLRDLIKQNNCQFSATVTPATSTDDKNNQNQANLIAQSSSNENLFKYVKSVHFFFNIDCWSYTKEEATEFLFNYIQCFNKLTNDLLIPVILDAFSCIIKLLSNFKNDLKFSQKAPSKHKYDFDFTFITETFLPFAFKKLFEYDPDSSKRTCLFCSIGRIIHVLKENFFLTLPVSKFWCVSMLSTLQKNTQLAIHAAIQACLEGLPYSFSLVHAIFISLSDRKVRDAQTVAFLACMSTISPEFRVYSLQELELISASSDKIDNNMACISIILLLHNLFNKSSQKAGESEKLKIDKEVRVIFLNSLGKMRSSPLLMSSLLHILPLFFEQLDNQFELIFDTILMDVNEVMIKLMKMTSSSLRPASSYTAMGSTPSNLSCNFPLNTYSSTSSVSSNMTKKNSSPYMVASSPIAFMSPSSLSVNLQPDSDPVLSINVNIQAEDNSSDLNDTSIRDNSPIQIFKCISLFCVKLFMYSQKRIQIRKQIFDLFLSWQNYNNERPNGEFYDKFKKILKKSIGFCFSPPKSKCYDSNLLLFKANDNVFMSKQTNSIFIIDDNPKIGYNVKAILDYSSSIYSVKPLRNSPIMKLKPSSSLDVIIDTKSKMTKETVLKSKLNRFRNLRSKNIDQVDANTQINSKNPEVSVPGFSLFLDALEEARGSKLEEAKAELFQADFVQKFESNFKKRFFIRLMFFGKKLQQSKNNSNSSETESISANSSNISSTDKEESLETTSASNGMYSDSYNFERNDRISNCGEFSEEFSPLFKRFLSSLGIRDQKGNIWAATTFYDAVYQMHPSSGQDVAVVWVDDSIFTESIINQLAIERRHLVLIVLNPSKSGIIHTKVLYSSLLLDAENHSNEDNGNANNNNNSNEGENDVFYFNSYYNYKYPSGEKISSNTILFFDFGPLVGSLFLPYTIVAKLVTETAINASVFRNWQLKNMNRNVMSKKKKRKLFQHRP